MKTKIKNLLLCGILGLLYSISLAAILDNLSFTSPIKFDDTLATGNITFTQPLSGNNYKIVFKIFDNFGSEVSGDISVTSGDELEIIGLQLGEKFKFYTGFSLSGCVILYSGGNELENKCIKVDFIPDTIKPEVVDSDILGVKGGEITGLVEYNNKRWINSLYEGIILSGSVIDSGVGIKEIRIEINGEEYKDIDVGGKGVVEINEEIGSLELKEGENKIEIIVLDMVGNENKEEYYIYKDTIKPEVVDSDIFVKFNSGKIGSLFKDKYFNSYMRDLLVTGSLVETGSGLEKVIIYMSGTKNEQLNGWFASFTGNDILFSGVLENFYNKQNWPDGQYEISVKIIDNVGNISYRVIKQEIIKDIIPPDILDLNYKTKKKFSINGSCDVKLKLSTGFVLYGCTNYALTNNPQVEFSGIIFEKTSGLSGVILKNVYYFNSGGNYVNVNLNVEYNIINNILSGVISGYDKDGLYFLNFILTDNAGNKTNVIVDRPFMYDSESSHINSISVEENGSLTPVDGYTNLFYIDSKVLSLSLIIDVTDLETGINHVAGLDKIIIKKYYRKDWNITDDTGWIYAEGKDEEYIFDSCDEKTFEGWCGKIDNYKINVNFILGDGTSLPDGIYKIKVLVYDRVGNVLEDDKLSDIYFVKDTDVPKITILRKYYMYDGIREDGWNVTDINDSNFNIQPAVYVDKDGKRRQKFRLYFHCVDTGNISNKDFPERPGSTGRVYLEVTNWHKIIYSGDIDFSKCNNSENIDLGEFTGFDLNTDYTFKVWLEDELGNSGRDNADRYATESFRTIPDYPRFVLKYQNSNSCDETLYVNSDCSLKKFEYVDSDGDGSGDIMMFTTPTNSVYICFTGINQPVEAVVVRYNVVEKKWPDGVDEIFRDLGEVTNSCYYLTGIFDRDNYDRKDFYVYFRSKKGKACGDDSCSVGKDYINMLKSRRVYVTLFKNEGIENLNRLDVFYNISIGTHLWYNPDSDERNRLRLIGENGKLSRNIRNSSKFVPELDYITGDDVTQLLNWLRNKGFINNDNYLIPDSVEGKYLYDKSNSNQDDKLDWIKLIGWIRKPYLITSNVPTPKNILYLKDNKFDGIVSDITIPTGKSLQRILLTPHFEDHADDFDITGNSYILEINPNKNSDKVGCFVHKCVWVYTFSGLYENVGNNQYKLTWRVNHYNGMSDVQISKTNFVVDMTPPKISSLNAMISSLKTWYTFSVTDTQKYAFWEGMDKHNIRYYLFDVTSGSFIKLCDWQNSNNICRLNSDWTDTDANNRWYSSDTGYIYINSSKLEDGHLYKLVLQIRDDAGNWSNYTHTLDITNTIGAEYKGNDTNNDFIDRPILDSNLTETGGYWIYFRQDFTHPITHDVIKTWQQSINYGRDDDVDPGASGYHKIEEDEINQKLTVNGLRFDIYAIYDYINGWSYFWYSGDYNDTTENEKNFMKLANVNPATKDGDVGIVLRIKADEFSKWQEINKNDPTATGNLKHTGIYRLYRWVVTPDKTAKENPDGLDKWVNVSDVENLISSTAGTTPGGLEVKIADWGKACKDIGWDNLSIVDIIDKKIENRAVMTDYFTGDLVQEDEDGQCKVVEPEVETGDRYMDCLPNFLMYKKGDYYYIVTKVVAPKTRDTSFGTDDVGSESFSGIIPPYVDNGIELRKHAWGRRNDYLANNISTQIKIRYQTLWGPPMPPEIIGYKGFVYKININNCSDNRLCNEADKIITGDFNNWYLKEDYNGLQIFYGPYNKDTEKYVRLRSEDIFAANPSKRIAQIVCIKASNYPYKLCYDLPGEYGNYQINKIWIDKGGNARLYDEGVDEDLTDQYGGPSTWCKRIKVSIDGKTVTSPTDSSILGKVYYQCDVPITDIINHAVNSIVTVSMNSSWYSEGCQDAYASVSSINRYFRFFSDFQKPNVSWFGVEGRWDDGGKRARVGRWLNGGNELSIWFYEPERKWGWKYNPDTAYLNNWKNSTWVEVYKVSDDGTKIKKFNTKEGSIKFNLFGAFINDNYNRKWFTDKYNFEEGKYKVIVYFADAPMYNNTGIYINYFFIDKNPPEVVDTLPYHKDSLVGYNSPWCKPYGADCSAIKTKINKFYNIFYASNIKHGGNIKTIYERRDDFINDQRLLVKDVSDILSGHTKFLLKFKDKNGIVKTVAYGNFDVKYGLGDPYNGSSPNYRYFILSTHTYNNEARSFEPGEYWIEYTICDIFATPSNFNSSHCTTGESVHWYYDPPLNELSLSDFKVEYYDGDTLWGEKHLLGYLNGDKNRIEDSSISDYLRSDGRFLYVETNIIKNHNIDDDGDDVVPDNTQILIGLKQGLYFGIYDLNRNKIFTLGNNDYNTLLVKDGKIRFLLKLPNNNIAHTFKFIMCPKYGRDPGGSINWNSDSIPDGCVILEGDIKKIIEGYKAIDVYMNSGDNLQNYSPYLEETAISTQKGYVASLVVIPSGNIVLKQENKFYLGSGLIYTNGELDAGYIYGKILANVNASLNPDINVGDKISSEEKKVKFNQDTYLDIPDKLLYGATQSYIKYTVGYRGYDYDGDGNPDFTNQVSYRWNRWSYPLKEVVWSGENNCQYLGDSNKHKGCTYFEIYADNKLLDKKTLKDKDGNKVRIFADAKQNYMIKFYVRDRYGNNLDSYNSIEHGLGTDSLILTGSGKGWCANQIVGNCDTYKEGLVYKLYDYWGYGKNNGYVYFDIKSFVPTMSGNKVILKNIIGSLKERLSYLSSIDSSKDIIVNFGSGSETEKRLYLKFYPLIYVFLKNITKEKIFKYGQEFRIQNYIKRLFNSSTNIGNITTFYDIHLDSKDTKIKQCSKLAYLVSLPDKNASIDNEIINGVYYSFADKDNVKIISGNVGRYLFFVPSIDFYTNQISLLEEGYVLSNDKQSLVEEIYKKIIYSGNDYKKDIKVKVNNNLQSLSNDVNLYLGGIVDVSDCRNLNIDDLNDLVVDLVANTYLSYILSTDEGTIYSIKLKTADARYLLDYNTEINTNTEEILSTLESDSDNDATESSTTEENTENIPKVVINPTNVQGFVAGKGVFDILNSRKRVRIKDKVISLSKELNNIKKKIAILIRGYDINYILNDSGIVIFDEFDGGIDESNSLSPSISFEKNGEKYYYYDFSNNLGGGTLLISGGFYEGKNILIVKGADIYIKNNISKYNLNDKNSGLILVVLKGENKKGGNIFIDPTVTNIDAYIIAEGSVLSAKDMNNNGIIEYSEIIDENNYSIDVVQDLLKNQLYIYGALHTRNTLGGAFEYKIPSVEYIILSGISNVNIKNYEDYKNLVKINPLKAQQIAKRFDINFLRYYLSILSGDEVIGTYTGSKIAGGYEWNGNEWIGGDPNLRKINDRFSTIIVQFDPVYRKFEFLK